jgi:predicted phosphodiesterase
VRYLILTDLHANLEALDAVLAAAEGRYDRVVCCGDLVGYGANPNEVCAWVQRHATAVVRGNHDKACCGLDDIEDYNPAARISTLWTMDSLTAHHREFLRDLPGGPLSVDGFQILHGSPADEDEYIVTPPEAAAVRRHLATPVSFFGHTHLQGGFFFRRNQVKAIEKVSRQQMAFEITTAEESTYLINPGSVGQPRDRDPRAAYVIYDTGEHCIAYYRVGYDVKAAQQKITDAGLPGILAARLAEGR